MSEAKNVRTRALRYKRPAMASVGYEIMMQELWDINEACGDVQWFVDSDDDTMLNALDGDEEAEFEFKMAFADVSAKAERLLECIRENVRDGDEYDDCVVSLIGNRYEVVGYDGDEEDYFALTGYEPELATTEAGKRIMRKTKAEMIASIGQCLGVVIAYLDLRQEYDYLKATMDILRDENMTILKTIKAIEETYKEAEADQFREWGDATRRFNGLINSIPERVWLE